MTGNILRLNFPQWQGGNLATYHLGSQLLSWLAPTASGDEATVEVAPPTGDEPAVENGIRSKSALLMQTDRAFEILRNREPGKIVVLGGDCLVDLAPFAYLNERYNGDLAVLWVDAHPDIATTDIANNAHAMVLGNLLGRGDSDFVKRVKKPLSPEKVMYAGLYDMSPAERHIVEEIGVHTATPNDLFSGSEKIISWLRATGARNVAIHFDLDVLDPSELRTLYFSRPHAAPDAFHGIPQGRMKIGEIVRLLSDVADSYNVVGLGITEFLPWDMAIVQDMLRHLPLLRDEVRES